jgi:hypothetical protein
MDHTIHYPTANKKWCVIQLILGSSNHLKIDIIIVKVDKCISALWVIKTCERKLYFLYNDTSFIRN